MQRELKKWRKDIWLSLAPTLPGRYVVTTIVRMQARLRDKTPTLKCRWPTKLGEVSKCASEKSGLSGAKTLLAFRWHCRLSNKLSSLLRCGCC